MRKTLVIASREYQAAVRTKSFLISLLILPLMMGGSIVLQFLLKDQVDTRDKTFAVIDRTPGQAVRAALAVAAARRNEKEIFDPETGKQVRLRFLLEPVPPPGDNPAAVNEQRLELSERARRGELVGFLEIGPSVAAVPGSASTERPAVRYQTNNPTFEAFPRWAQQVLQQAIQERRAAALGLSPDRLQALVQPVPFLTKGLTARNPETGAIEDAPDENRLVSFLAPGGLLILMLMMVLLGATPLMQGVVEEKMQRIAEVLLGSVRPFELMMGKLLGMVGVSLTLAVIYLGAAYWSAHRYGFAQYLSAELLIWFVVYQALAVLMYGSLFIAIGAAATDMRETQTLMWPVMLLATLPLFVWTNVIREPNSTFSQLASLFPPATPMLMIGRLAVPPGIPGWQPVLGVGLVLLTTVLCVYAAGRIFRVGLLMQGKGARFGEMVKWVIQG